MRRGYYRDLIAWQKGMSIVNEIYDLTDSFPTDERFGLTSQLRRSACSIPMNIAEGNGRRTNKDFAHFVGIAFASCLEVETAITITKNRGYIDAADENSILSSMSEIRKILFGLESSLLKS